MRGEIVAQQEQLEPLFFKGRLLPKLPLDYTEPSLNNPLVVPYGAMPANPFLDDAVKQQQMNIKAEHYKLYLSPPTDMPPSFVKVVADDYIINEPRREMENFEAHTTFIKKSGYPESESLAAEVVLYEKAQATIDQITDVLVQTEEDAGEFGKVGHPFAYRMQYIEPLRANMIAAIESRGGFVYPTIAPYRSIVIMPKLAKDEDEVILEPQRIVGFIVKYKRDFGRIPVPGSNKVINVVERQIAAFRVDEESGFDQKILDAMHELSDKYPDRVRWEGPITEGSLDRLARTGCKEFIESAIQRDSLEDFVVPVSTTIYGFKETIEEKPAFDLVARAAIERGLIKGLSRLEPSQSDAHLFDY